MEFFNKAKTVRLKSHHEKYLVAHDDEETVLQSHDGASHNARWTVEFISGDSHRVRLKSCYGKYLTASETYFPLSLGKKVVQDLPIINSRRLDTTNSSNIDWEPRTEGIHVKLRTRGGKFLRGNGGIPPWRNSVTHGVPHRTSSQDWVLWEVAVVDIIEDANNSLVRRDQDSFVSIDSISPSSTSFESADVFESAWAGHFS